MKTNDPPSSIVEQWKSLAAPVKALLIGGIAFGLLLFTCCGGCLSLAFLRNSSDDDSMDRERAARMADVKKQVDDADRYWESGEKDKAVLLYSVVFHNPDGAYYLDAERRGYLSTVASRIIDFKITTYSPESARDDIELATKYGASISVSTKEGNEFVASVRKEYRQRNQEAMDRMRAERKDEENTTSNSQQTPTGSTESDDKPLTYSVSKGSFQGSIIIEVDSHESITLSSLSYRSTGSLSQITFKITHKPVEGSATFRHRKDFYHFTAYDKDGVTLSNSFVFHEAIGPGETVLGKITLTVPDVARIVIHR